MSPSIRSITTTPWVRALAILLIAFVAACSGEGDSAANKAPPPPDDPAFPGTPVSDALSSLQGTCTIANHVASFPVAANETVILGRANSPTTTGGTVYNLTANGRVLACGSTNATVGGSTATVTQVAIDLNDAGSIIVDYSNGAFLPGGSAAGIAITGHGGTAYVKVKGTTAADKIYVAGTAAHVDIAINQTASTFKNDIDAVSASGDLQVTVSGGPGDDSITGQASNASGAFATAFTGTFTAYGAAGNDTMSPGASTSSLWGGIGNDTFVVPTSTANTATVAYFGEAGTDTIDFSHRTTHGVTIHMDGLASSAPAFAATGTGASAVNTAGGDTTAATEKMVVGDDIEVFNGSAGGDKVFGSTNGVTFNGGAGNDWFVAPAASTSTDVYKGGAGIDTVDFSLRSSSYPLTITMDGLTPSGAAGEKDLIGADVENFIGGQGDDTIIGNGLDNVIDGQGGNDVIYGGDGDDTIIGGAGNNALYGGNGDDTFMFAYDATSSTPSKPGNDTGTTFVNCGSGNNNTLDFSHETSAITIDLAFASTSTSFNGSGTVVIGGAGGKPVPKGAAVDTADACNNVFGGAGGNTINGNSLDNILDGNSTTSTIDGRAGVDTCINFGSGGTASHCEL